jgi:hypothetical protein
LKNKSQFCDVATIHTGNNPQRELAKIGYISEKKKTGQFKNPAIFWQPAGTCCLNMEIS